MRVTKAKEAREGNLVTAFKEIGVAHHALADCDCGVNVERREEAREDNIYPLPKIHALHRDARVAPPRMVPESGHSDN